MPDYSHAVISGHCLDQLAERKLSIDELALVLKNCDAVLASERERVILHKIVLSDGKTYLWRVVIDISCDPPKVVTVYRTSKLKKYLKEH